MRMGERGLLRVLDGEIAAAVEGAASLPSAPLYAGHASGAVGLAVLEPLAARGASAFGLHPLQTLPDRQAELEGAACAVAGSDDAALALASQLARTFGMRPFELAEEDRAAYHAAASMASNFLVALEESAAGLLGSVGIADGRELLAPLVLRTAANWAESGSAASPGRSPAATRRRWSATAKRWPPPPRSSCRSTTSSPNRRAGLRERRWREGRAHQGRA